VRGGRGAWAAGADGARRSLLAAGADLLNLAGPGAADAQPPFARCRLLNRDPAPSRDAKRFATSQGGVLDLGVGGGLDRDARIVGGDLPSADRRAGRPARSEPAIVLLLQAEDGLAKVVVDEKGVVRPAADLDRSAVDLVALEHRSDGE